jgi:hypothetical protein
MKDKWASRSTTSSPVERASSSHWMECWVHIRASGGFWEQNAEENKNEEVSKTLRKLHNEELQN